MSLRQFKTQADWIPVNIQAVSDAINKFDITTAEQLKNIVGNQSKKKYPNGEFSIGSKMLGLKLDSQKEMNSAEHQFYDNHTIKLKTFPRETTAQKGFLIFKGTPEFAQYKKTHPGYETFTAKVYDFAMGKHLADEGIKMMIQKEAREGRPINQDRASRLLVAELEESARLRGEEIELFKMLSTKVGAQAHEKAAIQAHVKAEERDISSLSQIKKYLENPDKIDELKSEASNYQKYLKYKAKYLALKKQLEQKN